MNLSKEAKNALAASHAEAGSRVPADPTTLAELKGHGLLDRSYNLSDKGAMKRDRVLRDREDEAFHG